MALKQKGVVILVVEDRDTTLDIVRRAIHELYGNLVRNILTAKTPQGAGKLLCNKKHAISVIILDEAIGKSARGEHATFVEWIQKVSPNSTVIAMCSNRNSHDEMMEAGCTCAIDKNRIATSLPKALDEVFVGM